MLTIDNLKNFIFWKSELGLLPVPLFRDTDAEQPLVLFNGNRGNFCIDWGIYRLGHETRNFSWSSNVSHYISASEDKFEVQQWDQSKWSIERYSFASVAGNFEKFHQYLTKKSIKHDLSVVSHAIRTFRKMRATLGTGVSGEEALRAFLYLLASIADNIERGHIDFIRWRLSEDAGRAADLIRPDDWSRLCDDIRIGRLFQGLKPNIELMLRHASGQLFQDAHYEAVFINPGQLSFDGFVPNPISVIQAAKGVGIHFTPPALARTVVEEMLNSISLGDDLTVFDPACGSGEFLREILRQLKINRYKGRVKLVGWDISAIACEMANFTLAWESRDATGPLDIEILNKDSLLNENEWPTELDIVVMNPPFMSWQDMDASQKNIVASLLGEIKEKRSDMSQAFIWKAAQSLKKDGILGTIVPASFFTNESAINLRCKLHEQMHSMFLARLGSHQLFSNAIVDAGIYIAKKQTTATQPSVILWADHRLESSASGLRELRKLRARNDVSSYPVISDGYSIYLDNLIDNERNWSPRPYESRRLAINVAGLPNVAKTFDVKQGVRTGHKKAFVLSQGQLFNLPENEGKYFRPCVVNDSIKYGYLSKTYYIFYPYGNNQIESEVKLREAVPSYYERYLLPGKSKLLERPRINPEKWWGLSEHRAWQVNPKPKLVSTYFGGRGSFAWDDSGNYVVVQGYAWIPRRPGSDNESAKAYLAILNSQFFLKLLSSTSNSVAGGQWDLSKKYVEKMRLPVLTTFEKTSSLLDKLAWIGSRIHAGLEYNEDKLELLVKTAYGVED